MAGAGVELEAARCQILLAERTRNANACAPASHKILPTASAPGFGARKDDTDTIQ
jgi:hypothetical protein